MKVNVIINAIFVGRFVKEQMELNLSKEATLKELFSEVKKRSGLDLRKLDGKGLTIMLSGRRFDFPADLETPLCDGDQLSVLSPIAGGIEYEYSREVLDAYRRSPAEWKLNWLEEVNKLTFQVLDEKHRALREKMRQGKV